MFLSVVQAVETVTSEGIGSGALTFMLISMGAVTTLAAWCFYRVLTTRRHFDPDGTGPAQPPISGRIDR